MSLSDYQTSELKNNVTVNIRLRWSHKEKGKEKVLGWNWYKLIFKKSINFY